MYEHQQREQIRQIQRQQQEEQKEEEVEPTFHASVTGLALQANIEYALRMYGVKKLLRSSSTHITGDRGSNCVKAGELMDMSFLSGILHGFGRVVWNSYNVTSKIRKEEAGGRRLII